MQRAFLSPPPSPLDRGHPGGPGGGRGEKNCPPLILPSSCFIDEHVTRVAWLNRSNILYAGNDRWTSDPRVRLLTNTPEEFSILITQVGLGDEGLYTCSFQTRHQPYTTQVYLIVHGEPSAGALAGKGGAGDGRWGEGTLMSSSIPGTPVRRQTHSLPSRIPARQRERKSETTSRAGEIRRPGGTWRKTPSSLAQPCFLSTCCVQALLHRPGTEMSQAGWPCLSGGVFPRRGSFPDITSELRPSGKRTARAEAGCSERERWGWRNPWRGGGRLASEVVWRAASTWRDRKPGTAQPCSRQAPIWEPNPPVLTLPLPPRG